MGFGHVPTPAKHVLLVHMNMLQGLKIHQGLKIKHIFTHQKLECLLVNVEPRELRWLGDRLPIQRSLVRTSGRDKKLFYKKSLVSKIASTFKTHVRLFFKNEQSEFEVLHIFVYSHRNQSWGSQTSTRLNYSLDHWCSIIFLSPHKNALYLFHVSLGDFTTVEMNAIEQTLNNSCSQSLARKRDSWKLEGMFSKLSIQVEFKGYQTSVCWNISILHYRGRNHLKSRVQVHP